MPSKTAGTRTCSLSSTSSARPQAQNQPLCLLLPPTPRLMLRPAWAQWDKSNTRQEQSQRQALSATSRPVRSSLLHLQRRQSRRAHQMESRVQRVKGRIMRWLLPTVLRREVGRLHQQSRSSIHRQGLKASSRR